eukprot:GAHX01000227.1.p1 GENE.GAHX01000227.1~~GAHX01000227.1.p1  ORF type:complete len:406 (-),score=79.84 GAHX01000227.1:35-1216(-)
MDQELDTTILDLGTGFLKIGKAGDNFPSNTFPTIVGRPILREGKIMSKALKKLKLKSDIIVGDLCNTYEGHLDTVFPVRNGIIEDDENMNHIWDYCFKDIMKLDKNKTNSILLTEAANNPLENKEKIVATMFERFDFDRVKIVPQAILTLYAQGLTTGLVLDSGDGVSHAMPVFNSFLVSTSVKRLDVAGSHVTQRLIQLLQLGGYYLNSSADQIVARKIKEKHCFIADNIERLTKLEAETNFLRTEYVMENGEKIVLERETYLAPECLFKPAHIGINRGGVDKMVHDCIQSTNINMRRDLYQHIVLSGGTTMLRGFPTRLETEIGELLVKDVFKGDHARLKSFKLRVEDPPRRKIMVFHGASLIGKIMQNDNDFWISKQEYEEKGKKIVSEK